MKTAADYAIDEIRDYIYHVEEMGSWYGLNFEEISFSKWAAMEIINRSGYSSSYDCRIVQRRDVYVCLLK